MTISRARAGTVIMFCPLDLKSLPSVGRLFASLFRLSLGLANRADPAKNDEDQKDDEGDKAETVVHVRLPISVTGFLQLCRIE